VRDILRVKYWLGLLDDPYRAGPEEAERVVRAPEHLAVAAQANRESVILLKNDNEVLPLRKNLKRIAVIGPLADNRHAWWSRYGPQHLEFVTILDGLRRKFGHETEIVYEQGVRVVDERFPERDVYKTPPSEKVRAGIEAAVRAAQGAEVARATSAPKGALKSRSMFAIPETGPGTKWSSFTCATITAR
jgi:beta-glucosidase